MTRYPGATWRPLPENASQPPLHATQPPLHATQLVFHSAVTKGASLFGYFNSPGVVVESHLYVEQNGDCEQYLDWDTQADAQAQGNLRALSCETWDNADPAHVPWNPAQLDRLVDVAVQAHLLKGVPLMRCPAWDAPGIGQHSDWPQWNPNAHSCVGAARYGQVAVIIDRARALLARPVPPVVIKPGPIIKPTPVQPGIRAPVFPLPRGSYFGPKDGPATSVSGWYGHSGDLQAWQHRMQQRGWHLNADGHYLPATRQVALAFQAEKHLTRDGLIGPACWAAAWTTAIS